MNPALALRSIHPARLAGALLVALAGCKSNGPVPPPPDGGSVACLDATPCALVSDVAQTGTISAVGQVDVYTVTSTSASTLVKLQLSDPAPATPVRLTMLLLQSDGITPVGVRGPAAGTGVQNLAGTFLLPGPGTYKLLVRDLTSTKVDAHNSYTLTATLFPDPDALEPDDTPPQARPLTPAGPGAALATVTGLVAYSGDVDLVGFDLAAPQLVRITAAQAAAGGTLRLRVRLLQRSAATPDVLANATTLVSVSANLAGAALAFDQVRSLPAGRYLVALDDTPVPPATVGTESDERAAAQWTVGLGLLNDPDPNEQTGRNDTPATATPLTPGSGSANSITGAIGSQGDVDWYAVQLPAASTPQIIELTFDPQKANQLLALNWSVGTAIANPTAACDINCGPSAFCSNPPDGGAGVCAYAARAVHHYMRATSGGYDTTVEKVRLRHFGPAETIWVVVDDQGGLDRSNDLYKLSAQLFPDPDPNEQTTINDTIPGATPVGRVDDADGGYRVAASGKISWWESNDDKTQRNNPGDVDYYAATLPAPQLAPNCPADAGPADGGPIHLSDGGLCGPDPYDGGPVYEPMPDYQLAMRWNNPSDGVYRIGMQGVVVRPDGRQACLFSFDDVSSGATQDGGSWSVGDDLANDPCFCLPGAAAAQAKIWLAAESTHRPTAPAGNTYSDGTYDFTLSFHPVQADGGLQAHCQGRCALPPANACPGR